MNDKSYFSRKYNKLKNATAKFQDLMKETNIHFLFLRVFINLAVQISHLIIMNPQSIFFIFLCYTALLFFITWLTARKSNSDSFYRGNKASPWYVVAYGMIGASLSGVTFMSVPGWVKDTQFSYMMVVFGYLAGYFVI
ncbi:MAG: hypothetical protein Q8905_07140, partial [Bacteroidota bacterium]|nr:hypothetical protein [Bacteroidota bacterium]